MQSQSLWVRSGLAGIAAVSCYFLAILIPWPENQVGTSTGLLVVSAFPILGIVFSYGIHSAWQLRRRAPRTDSDSCSQLRHSPCCWVCSSLSWL